jgi:hypothetical protein
MISDDELLDLPEDPELAFVECERKFREIAFKRLEQSDSYDASKSYMLEYISNVVAAANALDCEYFDKYGIPTLADDIRPFYEQFLLDVSHLALQIRMRYARRIKRYSVALD